jgi:hypothetical protein
VPVDVGEGVGDTVGLGVAVALAVGVRVAVGVGVVVPSEAPIHADVMPPTTMPNRTNEPPAIAA